MSEQTFKQHAVVELFGHNQIAGLVTEQAIGGATFVRVDVPKTSAREGFTKFFGAGAIYAITPVDESVAARMAEALEVAPVQEWRLQTLTGGADVPRLPAVWDDEADEDEVEVEYWTEEQKTRYARLMDKTGAAEWARELLAGEFVIVDTETTGFEADDEIIQIGIVDHTGATAFESLIKPAKPITNSQYHGITDETVKDAPGFEAVYPAIRAALEHKRVIAYNADYDWRMLRQEWERHGLAPIVAIPGVSHCAMHQYAAFNGDWNDYRGNYRWVKLREALAHFGLKHEDFGDAEHDAVTDAKATLALIQKMAEWRPEVKS